MISRLTKIRIAIAGLVVAACCVMAYTSLPEENSDNKLSSSVDNPILFAKLSDRQLAYRTVGKGLPIILCNRFRGNLDDWDPAFLDALAQKGYQVITFDYSGLASSTGKPATTVMDWVNDVKDLAAALGFKKFIVGGWSLGGFAAEVLTTEYPELVTHTILIGTKPPGQVQYSLEEIFLKTAWKPNYSLEDETILFFEPTSEKSRIAAKASHDRIAKRTKFKDKLIEQSLWSSFTEGSKDFMDDPYKCREKLMSTSIPILVISADHEVCFPPQNWYDLTRKLPTTELIVIPQTGHGPQHQLPEYTSKLIDNFIKENK